MKPFVDALERADKLLTERGIEVYELRKAVRAVAPKGSANEITVRKAVSFEVAERIYGEDTP